MKKEKEPPYNFAKRRFCGLACFGASRRNLAPPAGGSDCEQCGDALVRREKEPPYNFAKRRFCGLACYNASRMRSIDVLGIIVTHQDLADALGITTECITLRVNRGRCPVSGKKTK